MASWFQLTLDTHAPIVIFGAADSTGGALSVPYTINEPAIASAWVVDSAGQRVDLTVEPSRLYAVLPETITSGWATVTARAVDSVGNAHDYTLAVMLVSGVGPPPPAPAPPPDRPARIAPRPRKFVRSRVIARQACPATVRTSTTSPRTVAPTRSGATTAAVVRTSAALTTTSAATTRARVSAGTVTRGHAELSNVELHRRVGRSVEEALLLDLL